MVSTIKDDFSGHINRNHRATGQFSNGCTARRLVVGSKVVVYMGWREKVGVWVIIYLWKLVVNWENMYIEKYSGQNEFVKQILPKFRHCNNSLESSGASA